MAKQGTIFGFTINTKSFAEVIEQSVDAIEKRESQKVFVCANAYSMMVTRKDPLFSKALADADFLVADGAGVSLSGKVLGIDVGPRIPGYEYFEGISQRLNKGISGRKARIFFFGSSQTTLDKIVQRMAIDFPGLEVCGVHSPPFGEWSEEENNRMIEVINSASPDVLWVGMTAPKQEKWSFQNREQLDSPVIGSIGAVFDFYAGTVARAPAWMRALNLEWFHRLITNPKKTWKRYLVAQPIYMFEIFKQYLKNS